MTEKELLEILERIKKIDERMKQTARLEKIMKMINGEDNDRKKILLFKLYEEELDCLSKKLKEKNI